MTCNKAAADCNCELANQKCSFGMGAETSHWIDADLTKEQWLYPTSFSIKLHFGFPLQENNLATPVEYIETSGFDFKPDNWADFATPCSVEVATRFIHNP